MATILLLASNTALAVFHLYVVEQVYSNAAGNVQFVVLFSNFSGQDQWKDHALTTSTHSFPITTNLPSSNTAGRRVLIGTQSFAALGIVTPDYIVPDGFIGTSNDFVDFASVSRLNFTSLPTDGVNARYATGEVKANLATNFAGVSGTVTAPTPSNHTALWWNPAESGWGININHQGNILFATLFTYEATGTVMWLVMSNGALQSNGTFTGDLFRTTGSPFNANPFVPLGPSNVTQVGTMTLSFSGDNNGTLSYTVNGTPVTKAIQRQVFGSRAANCVPSTGSRAALTNYQDLWWISTESGWGVNITHQDNTLFATLFTYDATGKGLWLVMSNGARQQNGSYSGQLFQTTGSAFNANPFVPLTGANITQVGNMQFTFADGEHGTMVYTVNGISVTKQIIRQVFGTPWFACS